MVKMSGKTSDLETTLMAIFYSSDNRASIIFLYNIII